MHLGQSQAWEGEKGSNESTEQCQDQLKGQLGYGAPVETEEESKAYSLQGSTNHHIQGLIPTHGDMVYCIHTHSLSTDQGGRGTAAVILTETQGLGSPETSRHFQKNLQSL